MSITTPDVRLSAYEPTTPTKEFAAGFSIWNNADLAVFHNGVRRTDFAVTATYDNSGSSTNAKVIFATGLTGKVNVVGLRSPRRNSRFVNGGPLSIDAFNLALDVLTAENQELSRDVARSLKVEFGTAPMTVTPGATGQLLAFDGNGNLVPTNAGSGDMRAGVYDPDGKGADVFDLAYSKGAASYFGAKGDGVTNDAVLYAAAEAAFPSVYLAPGKIYNIGSAIPAKLVSGPGAIKRSGVVLDGFEPAVNPYNSSIVWAPSSHIDLLGQVAGGDATVLISVNADRDVTKLNRSTVVGTQNLVAPVIMDRVELFGNLAGQRGRRLDRVSAFGSTCVQFFGSYEADVKANHNYWTDDPGGFKPGQVGWNVADYETLSPGIGAQIAAFAGYITPTTPIENASRTAAFGRNAFNLIVVGSDNAGFGYRAGSAVYSGSGNAFFGVDAGKNNIFVDDQAAFGFEAARDWVNGARNSIFGRGAARQVIAGVNNAVFGVYAAGDHKKLNNSVVIGPRAANGLFTDAPNLALEDALVIANSEAPARKPLIAGRFSLGSLALNAPDMNSIGDIFRIFDLDGNRVADFNAATFRVGRTADSTTTPGVGVSLSKNNGNLTSFMAGTGSNTHAQFRNNAEVTPTVVGSIISNGSATVYNTASDATWKDDEGELAFDHAREILTRIAFHQFKWNERSSSPGVKDHGVFAQELYEIYPRAVSKGGWYDAETGAPAEGEAEGAEYLPWSVDYSKLMTVVARCVQGTMHKQDEILQRLSELEGPYVRILASPEEDESP